MTAATSCRRWVQTLLVAALGFATAVHAGAAVPATAPALGARAKPLIEVEGLRFRDLDASGDLTPYEDWRLPVAQRVADLVSRMTRAEKAGLMMVDTLNGGCGGALPSSASDLVNQQHMRRFILRNVVDATPSCSADQGVRAGARLTPVEAARYTNAVQQLAEASRLGIPVLFKSNARNHYERDPRTGINNAAGSMSEFPKEAGLAAAALGEGAAQGEPAGRGDMAVLRRFGSVMGREWRAIGLRGMYGYMADLATEPRWYRVHETFTEDADLAADILATLVGTLQGGPLTPASDVALTLKHFPGGGPQQLGLDPHYSFGKHQVYPAGRFDEHMKPFRAAIDAGVAGVMPYYGVPVGVSRQGQPYEEIGMAFSRRIVTDLLRGELGFRGYVNSDTGIITERAWGLEQRSVAERIATAINGGTDTLSGFHEVATLVALVDDGLVAEARLSEAAGRLLAPLFQMGLFEDPYVDAEAAASVVGQAAHRSEALALQRKSIVLLQNRRLQDRSVLPLQPTDRLYTLGIAPEQVRRYFPAHRAGDLDAAGQPLARDARGSLQGRVSARGFDRAVLRVEVHNHGTQGYRSRDIASGANPALLNPLTGRPWGMQDPCVLAPASNPQCVDDGYLGGPSPNGLVFGGALPWEADALSFTAMAAARSWRITPTLEDIRQVMAEVGPGNVVLSINFRQPFVVDEASQLREAGALLANFGVGDEALLDVLSGAAPPQGRLPFALPANLQAVVDNAPDAPGYPPQDTLYPFGYGLSY